ncbi:ribonucleoprotein PTB-binding 1 isoform X3 [Ixodes scapularis]
MNSADCAHAQSTPKTDLKSINMAACSTAGVRSVGLNSGIAMKDCYSQIKGGEKICSGDANCPFINGNDAGQGEERWLQSLRQFHNGRNLQMVHLSPSVTEKDIIDFFQQTGTLVKKVEINRRTHIGKYDPLLFDRCVFSR